MPKAQVKSKSKGKKANGRARMLASVNPDESVVIYRGPSTLPMGASERACITTVLHYGTAAVTSNGSGFAAFSLSDDPSGFVDWSHIAAAWDEYRVLALTMNYVPYNQYNTPTATVVSSMFTVIDRDDATALTTEAAALEYESLKVFYLGRPFKRVVKMASIEDASFITTASPVARNWIKGAGSGLTASTSYGKYWLTVLIQCRGRN